MRRVTLLVSLTALALPRDAQAQAASNARLEVTRTPEASGCPDARALEAATTRLAGHRVTSDEGTERATVAFSRQNGQFRATVAHGNASGAERLLADDGATCDALGEAVALSLVVLLDVSASAPPTSTAPRIDQLGKVDATQTRRRDPNHVQNARNDDADHDGDASALQRSWSWGVRAGVGGAYGVLDGLTPLVWAGVIVNTPSWLAFTVEGTWLPSDTTTLTPGAVHAHLLAATGGLCVRPLALRQGGERGVVHLDACGTFSAGSLSVDSEGFSKNGDASRAYFAAGLNATFAVSITEWLETSLRAAGMVPLRRDTFFIDGAGDVFKPAIAGVFVGAGLGASFR